MSDNSILYRTSSLDVHVPEEGRSIWGTVVPYNEVTTIADSGGRTYLERFQVGAFARSIAERGSKIQLYVGHETMRKLPVGRAVELEETSEGLQAVFELGHTSEAEDALTAIREGLVDSFSVGFRPLRQVTRDGVIVRTEASLREVSLVGMPAYSGALVGGVRSDTPQLSVDMARKRLSILLNSF
jgi:HK97 family phage prohead protease